MPTLELLLVPAELPQSPPRIPYFAHFCDFPLAVHGERVDVIRVRFLAGRWNRTAFADVGGRKCRDERSGPIRLDRARRLLRDRRGLGFHG